ncbi:MAG: Dabb family protein [Candidatus Hydrogenedentales bacterium]|jgi:hypothetical protein
MLVHSVYFWLKSGQSDEEIASFRGGLESLVGIDSARGVYVGTPAATNRPVIDRSYTFALTVLFDDMAGHDAYQVHPLHTEFLKTFGSRWERVVIYDAE